MKRRKLLIFHPALAPYRVDFFNELNTVFKTSLYFSYNNVQDQKFDQNLLMQQLEINPILLKKGFSIFNRPVRFGVVNIIRNIKPDLVICSEFGIITFVTVLYLWICRKKIKVFVLTDDSINCIIERKGLHAIGRKIVVRCLSGLIVTGKEVSIWYKSNVSKSIQTLELPIIHDDKRFRKKLELSLEYSKAIIRNYSLEGDKVVLFVGRLVEVKNVSTLLEAIASIKDVSVKLVIIGDGYLMEGLQNLASVLDLKNRVIFTGRREYLELYAWYNVASILVLPSILEPFGAVVNEALLGGCRVICSNKAGASTLIQEQVNGTLFSPNSVEELNSKLKEYLDNAIPIFETDNYMLRPSLMPFTFDNKIKTFLSQL